MRVYPFKALDGVDVSAAEIVARGALRRDREFALVDAGGAFVNGKREPRVHALRVDYDADVTSATFRSPHIAGAWRFAFDDDPAELCAWLERHFECPLALHRDQDGGFPDDTASPGPTVVSTATLEAVASWFPGLDADAVRRRLRANVEIGGVPAFWEDTLFAGPGEAVAFRAGEVVLEGTNPCARCVVPSRDPLTGVPLAAFQKRVAERRAALLPPWAERARFDHFYRLAVNTRPAAGGSGQSLRCGDPVERLAVSARESPSPRA